MTSQKRIVGVEYSRLEFEKTKFMPSYHRYKVGDGKYKVAINPTGIRKCLRFLPYYNGSDVNLAVFAKNLSQQARQLSYHYILYRCDEQEKKLVDTKDGIFDLEPKWKNERKISKHLIIPGEYYATLDLSESTGSFVQGQHMVSFTLLSKDIWTANLIMVIISVIIGVVIGWLLAGIH